jgi:hypothetical protein
MCHPILLLAFQIAMNPKVNSVSGRCFRIQSGPNPTKIADHHASNLIAELYKSGNFQVPFDRDVTFVAPRVGYAAHNCASIRLATDSLVALVATVLPRATTFHQESPEATVLAKRIQEHRPQSAACQRFRRDLVSNRPSTLGFGTLSDLRRL